MNSSEKWISSAIPSWHLWVDVRTLTRYLARVLPDAEADEVRTTLSHNPASRDRMIGVAAVLKRVQAMALTDVVRLKGDTLEGEVAAEWLNICQESVQYLVALQVAKTKVSLSDLIEESKAKLSSAPFVRMILQGFDSPRPIAAALYRSQLEPSDLTIEANLDEAGQLLVSIRTHPEQAEAWEGRTVEVCMQVQVPIVVGTGIIHSGHAEFRVAEAGSILGRTPGPIDGRELSITYPASKEIIEVLPIEARDRATAEDPHIVESPRIENGRFTAQMYVPESFLGVHSGKQLELFAQLAPGQWQKISSIGLASESHHDLDFEMPGTAELSGNLPAILRYRIVQ